MYKFSIVWLISVITSTLVLSSCSITEAYLLDFYDWFGLKHDNKAEEALEAVVEYKTGVPVDFTPSSPEGV